MRPDLTKNSGTEYAGRTSALIPISSCECLGEVEAAPEPNFKGLFLLEDLCPCLNDLEELAERLDAWAEKCRAIHRDGVIMVGLDDPTCPNAILVGTNDPEVADAWELEEEGEDTPLQLS
jgi:hypothetical protein